MVLNSKPPMEIEHNGKTFHLIPWFDNVLDFFDVAEGCTQVEFVDLALSFFIQEQTGFDLMLFNTMWKTLFGKGKQSEQNVVDFKQDAERIYAGFLQAYGIDLFAEHGKMHWHIFTALLGALPSDTAFAEVVSIRARELPKPNKYNQKEIAELMRLKAKYAIKETDETKKNRLNKQWGSVFDALVSRAKGSE